MENQIRFMRRREVLELLGLSHTTVYKMVDEGRFPRPLRIGPNTTRWRSDQVTEWMEAQMKAAESA